MGIFDNLQVSWYNILWCKRFCDFIRGARGLRPSRHDPRECHSKGCVHLQPHNNHSDLLLPHKNKIIGIANPISHAASIGAEAFFLSMLLYLP